MPSIHITLKTVKLLIATLLLLTLIGCGGESPVKKSAGKALQDAPSEVAALYKAQCISCHGSELQGRVGANTNLTGIGSRMSEDELLKQIQNGERTMPPFKDTLTLEEITSLAEWLSTKK
ncbi:cytochrome c [Paenibacillus sp. L3-i20]|uniref:c-type cytochrome n=1 Tax=Paenibacillus sp. L3-i20 TaxID=2905833 RepID=UPI00208C16A9|nr:cytochrome c [Paenibacillus sp. L3-i20]GKU80423.1 hypothetical protein L3i20_v248200 [Paenibacillus sp. L3-i20]